MADLHSVALSAEKSLEQLATGLAQAGADPNTVKAVTQMAEVTRKIVAALGKGAGGAPQGQPSPQEQQQAATNQGSSMSDARAQAQPGY